MTLLPTAPPEDRDCGECQACCEVIQVYATNDRAGVPLADAFERCQHQCQDGCEIYGQHPRPCAVYHCMWRLGWRGDDARPDRLGVLVEGTRRGWLFAIETRSNGYAGLAADYCRETRDRGPGAYIHITPWRAEDPEGWWDGEMPTMGEFEAAAEEEGV